MRGVAWRVALARGQRALSPQALGQRAVHWAWHTAQRAGAVTAGSPAAQRFAAFGAG